MKKSILLLLGMMVALFAQAEEKRSFLLAPAGDMDSALVERVRVYLETYTDAAVSLAPAVAMEPGQSLETIGRTAAKTLGTKDPGIIVLARPTDAQPQGVCLPDFRFAVLNIVRLEVDADEDQLVRRAGQEGLRVISMMMGMSACPFPLCVLVGYEKVDDLDRMSGSFCPPCHDRFIRLASEAGLQMIEPPVAVAEEMPIAPAEENSAIENHPAEAVEDAPVGESEPMTESEPEGALL